MKNMVIPIPEATVSQYVNNKRTPEIDKMVKIANFFNVTLDYIMRRTDVDSDVVDL